MANQVKFGLCNQVPTSGTPRWWSGGAIDYAQWAADFEWIQVGAEYCPLLLAERPAGIYAPLVNCTTTAFWSGHPAFPWCPEYESLGYNVTYPAWALCTDASQTMNQEMDPFGINWIHMNQTNTDYQDYAMDYILDYMATNSSLTWLGFDNGFFSVAPYGKYDYAGTCIYCDNADYRTAISAWTSLLNDTLDTISKKFFWNGVTGYTDFNSLIAPYVDAVMTEGMFSPGYNLARWQIYDQIVKVSEYMVANNKVCFWQFDGDTVLGDVAITEDIAKVAWAIGLVAGGEKTYVGIRDYTNLPIWFPFMDPSDPDYLDLGDPLGDYIVLESIETPVYYPTKYQRQFQNYTMTLDLSASEYDITQWTVTFDAGRKIYLGGMYCDLTVV